MLTETSTYVSTRIEMINDHFELFLRCGGLSDFYIDKMLLSAKNHELEAVGIYIEENGYRIAEVEFNVDWNKHNDLVKLHGEWFDTNCPGWKNGQAPEAYVAAQRLMDLAKQKGKKVRSWICVTDFVRNDPKKHKAVCDALGYSFGSSVSPWKSQPKEHTRIITYLEEAKVIQRLVL